MLILFDDSGGGSGHIASERGYIDPRITGIPQQRGGGGRREANGPNLEMIPSYAISQIRLKYCDF